MKMQYHYHGKTLPKLLETDEIPSSSGCDDDELSSSNNVIDQTRKKSATSKKDLFGDVFRSSDNNDTSGAEKYETDKRSSTTTSKTPKKYKHKRGFSSSSTTGGGDNSGSPSPLIGALLAIPTKSFGDDCYSEQEPGETSATKATTQSDTCSDHDCLLLLSPGGTSSKKKKKTHRVVLSDVLSDLEQDEEQYDHKMKQVKQSLLKESRAKKELRRKERRKQREAKHLMYIMEAMETERAVMMKQFKEELEHERLENSFLRRSQKTFERISSNMKCRLYNLWLTLVVFLSNLPLTVGAIALAWVTMGVDWYKFTEEMIDDCTPVAYRSLQCTFQEFPGCFDCSYAYENSNRWYQLALHFHYTCHTFAALLLIGFVLKVILAYEIVLDELSNPTTSTPCGLVLITTCVIGAALKGTIFGSTLVLGASLLHVVLYVWFVSMAIRNKMLPDPGWAPNTVGICYAAVKTWLYYPDAGYILMGICLTSFCLTFPISLLRVALNTKISANVAWIQLSVPAVTLYSFSLMSQPSTQTMEEQLLRSASAIQAFRQWHMKYEMPIMHGLFGCCLLATIMTVWGFYQRYNTFKQNKFSPAHAAFCFPILSHANAVQAYRGVMNKFLYNETSSGPWLKIYMKLIFTYWFIFITVGTIVTLVVTAIYLYHLPKWCLPVIDDDDEHQVVKSGDSIIGYCADIEKQVNDDGASITVPPPPEPSDTIIHEIIENSLGRSAGAEHIRQPYISPMILQANEAGALVRVIHRRRLTSSSSLENNDGNIAPNHFHHRRDSSFVRTLNVNSLGFEPKLTQDELDEEREHLLDYVAQHPPKPRHDRTVSHLPSLFPLFPRRNHMLTTTTRDAVNGGATTSYSSNSNNQDYHRGYGTVVVEGPPPPPPPLFRVSHAADATSAFREDERRQHSRANTHHF